jgi:hypothetical protein
MEPIMEERQGTVNQKIQEAAARASMLHVRFEVFLFDTMPQAWAKESISGARPEIESRDSRQDHLKSRAG